MHLNRPDTDLEPAGNISIRIALRHEFENFFLSRRQPVCTLAGWLGRFDRFGLLAGSRSPAGLRGLYGLCSFL